MKLMRFFFYFLFLFFRLGHKFIFATNKALAAHPILGSIISGGHVIRPSQGLQYGHTNWYGGHTTIKLTH